MTSRALEQRMDRMTRRQFVKRAVVGSVVAGGVYPWLEAKWCRLTRQTVAIPNLPTAFDGTTIAYLSDVHHGPFVPSAYVRSIVAMTNSLNPDLVLLGGDYSHHGNRYVAPAHADLARLRARVGRYAVLGNHDSWDGLDDSIASLDAARIPLLRNRGIWIERGGSRLRIAGVGDLWTDQVELAAAIGAETTDRDAVILLSHNPDVAEHADDSRIGLMISGHTHGGQVVIPGFGAPIVPTAFGQKYVQGLVQAPRCQVYVGRGVGTVTPPVRLLCRPEVVWITLRCPI